MVIDIKRCVLQANKITFEFLKSQWRITRTPNFCIFPVTVQKYSRKRGRMTFGPQQSLHSSWKHLPLGSQREREKKKTDWLPRKCWGGPSQFSAWTRKEAALGGVRGKPRPEHDFQARPGLGHDWPRAEASIFGQPTGPGPSSVASSKGSQTSLSQAWSWLRGAPDPRCGSSTQTCWNRCLCKRLHHPTHGTQPTAASPRGNQSGWRLRHPDQQKGQALRRGLSNDPCGPARSKPWHTEPNGNAAVLRGVYIPTFPLCKSPTCPGQGTQAALSPERKLRCPVALLPETILWLLSLTCRALPPAAFRVLEGGSWWNHCL